MSDQRHIIKSLDLDEISAVDTPAQEGARAVIIKRAEGKGGDPKKPAMPLARRLVEAIHSQMRKASMNINIESEITKAAEAAKGEDGNVDIDAFAKAVVGALSPVVAEADEVKKVAAMPQAHQDYLTQVAKSAQMSAEQKAELRKAFIAADSDTARDAVVKEWDSASEVFKSAGGQVFRRAELGAAFDTVVEQVKKAEDTEKRLAELEKRNADAELIRKSKEEFPNLPGDDSTRLALEKSLSGMDDEEAKKVREMLKSGSNNIGKMFGETGVGGGIDGGGGGSTDADAKLNDLAKAMVQKRAEDGQPITHAEAYAAVLETPQGEELYEAHRREQLSQAQAH